MKTVILPLLLCLLCLPLTAFAQDFWGALEAGEYQVGFKTTELFDESRIFSPELNYFGEKIDGDRARPIQICIWYPAIHKADEYKMTYSEYEYPMPNQDKFIDAVAALHGRHSQLIMQFLGNNRGKYMDFINQPMAPVKDAESAEGNFPVLFYFPHMETGYFDNFVLCEYLASNGFIVVTVQMQGLFDAHAIASAQGVELTVRDAEFVFGHLNLIGNIDREKIGAIGFGLGGFSALLFQMRNKDIDAVSVIGGGLVDTAYQSLLTNNPYYDPALMQVPLYQTFQDVNPEPDLRLTNEFKYANRYDFQLNGSATVNYFIGGKVASFAANAELTDYWYEYICRTNLHFMKNALSGSSDLIEPSLAEIELGSEFTVERSFIPAAEIPPNQNQFNAMLREGKIDFAIETFKKFSRTNPGFITVDNNLFNNLGYGMLNQGRHELALDIFKINAETYPNSANCWDSYADGLIAAGKLKEARSCYLKVLETLPQDNTIGDAMRGTLETNAKHFLEQNSESN